MRFVKLPCLEEFTTQLRDLAADPNPITAAQGRMLLELVEELQSSGPVPKVRAMMLLDKVVLSWGNGAISIWVDWMDYGEVRDGLPVMHDRFQVNQARPAFQLRSARSYDQ